MISRRGFIGALLAAPVIVRASSLMHISPLPSDLLTVEDVLAVRDALRINSWRAYYGTVIANPAFLKRIDSAIFAATF